MAKIPIQIGSHSFPSKTDAKKYVRQIVARYADDETITGTDDLFLRDLVAIHPEATQKVGCGIAQFTIRVDPKWRTTRHFVIIRTDGTDTDVSFPKCIDGDNHRGDVLHALRHAVAEQVIAFKRAAFSGDILPICPYTDDILSVSDAHVDHAPPGTFFALATRWMQANAFSFADIRLVDTADNQWVCTLRDAAQEESWRAFHQSHARLRIISRIANLSHAKRQHQSA